MSQGLGRGLSSLIPNRSALKGGPTIEEENRNINKNSKDTVSQVDLDKIKVNSMQPRQNFNDYSMDELVSSIKEYGIIQPLIISPVAGGKYELIAGERRLRAAKKAGLKEAPVVIRNADRQEKLELALIENIQRDDLSSVELAAAYCRLADEFNLTQQEIAKRVGKARSSVANIMRLLNLPEDIQIALADGKITEGHAKYLAGLDSEAKQSVLFKKIIHNNMSVYDTGKEIRKSGGTKQARIKINYRDKDKEFALREFFGAKVEIRRKGRGGQIIIDFYSDEELAEMVGKIK